MAATCNSTSGGSLVSGSGGDRPRGCCRLPQPSASNERVRRRGPALTRELSAPGPTPAGSPVSPSGWISAEVIDPPGPRRLPLTRPWQADRCSTALRAAVQPGDRVRARNAVSRQVTQDTERLRRIAPVPVNQQTLSPTDPASLPPASCYRGKDPKAGREFLPASAQGDLCDQTTSTS